MTVRNFNSRVCGWHCSHGCTGPRATGSGYASETAAARAEQRHNEQARHTPTETTR